LIKSLKNFYWYITAGIILIILLTLTSAGFAQPASTVILRVVPEDAQVLVNGTLDIAVEVEDVEGLYGIDILLEFNPQALEVVDMDPDLDGVQIQLGTFLEPGFVILNLVNNEIGRLRLAMTQLAPAEPKSGTGNLIVVRFRGKTADLSSAVTIVAATLAGPTGNLIEINTLEDGSIDVVQTLPPGPTNTPIPAVPPGTPMPTNTPTAEPTPDPGATADPGGPAPTPTDRFLFIPPTFTPSSTPTATHTTTPTEAATATLAPTATQAAEVEVQPTDAAPDTGGEAEPGEGDQADGVSPWWFVIPVILIAAGAAGYYLWRKLRPVVREN
jgi:hypothetical protein